MNMDVVDVASSIWSPCPGIRFRALYSKFLRFRFVAWVAYPPWSLRTMDEVELKQAGESGMSVELFSTVSYADCQKHDATVSIWSCARAADVVHNPNSPADFLSFCL